MSARGPMRWLVRSDIDGFFGLALDNLVQLLVIDALCRSVLGFDDALVRGQILPGVAISVLLGNLYYARQAMGLARREGRTDVCALPYGINTVSVFGFVFLVMLPAKLAAGSAPNASQLAFRAGLVACFGSGVIELLGGLVAERLRRVTPRAALLSTLSGIALGFISLGFLLRAFARPEVGLPTLAIVIIAYFGRVRFRAHVPAGLVTILLGTALAWLTGIAPASAAPPTTGFYPPWPVLGELIFALSGPHALTYLSVIAPMGLFNLLGSLQNIESADAAGDRYDAGESLVVNGVGTLLGAALGSCFPTTLYIGHPAWKAMGARAGYSVLSGVFVAVICVTGAVGAIAWAVPVDAGLAIVIWIGLVITAEAFVQTPRREAPAVVVGILPGVAAWGALMTKAGLRAAPSAPGDTPIFSSALLDRFQQADVWVDGAFALEQGFLFSAMGWSAITVCVIHRRFSRGALWAFSMMALSAVGVLHSYRFTPADTVLSLGPSWRFVKAYAAMGILLLLARRLTVPTDHENSGSTDS